MERGAAVTDRLILVGAGGHAKVVLEAILAGGGEPSLAVLDDAEAPGKTLLGHSVRGSRSWLLENWAGAPVVPAIGSNAVRARLIEWLLQNGRSLRAVRHPSATISPSAVVAEGSFVAPGAVINAEARILEGAIINTAASIDHDCRIGFAAHVAPGARLCGGVQIGARTLVGAGSVIIPGVKVGEGCVIGAGSVVIRDLMDGARVAGSPARAI